jgi:pimeloyl-ACP methyl ester carboxylesterase
MFIYTPRANNDGTVDQIIEEVLAFPHKQAPEDTQRRLDAFIDHDTSDRLAQIVAPTLVLAGGLDMTSRPELCRAVAELIPYAQSKDAGERHSGGPPRILQNRSRRTT